MLVIIFHEKKNTFLSALTLCYLQKVWLRLLWFGKGVDREYVKSDDFEVPLSSALFHLLLSRMGVLKNSICLAFY